MLRLGYFVCQRLLAPSERFVGNAPDFFGCAEFPFPSLIALDMVDIYFYRVMDSSTEAIFIQSIYYVRHDELHRRELNPN
jgi:hypothetical protein